MEMEVERMNNVPRRIPRKVMGTLSEPAKAAWVVLILCVALVFTLGGLVKVYSNNHTQENKIEALQRRNAQSDKIAIQACLKTRPAANKLFKGLITYYTDDYNSVHRLVSLTEKGTPAWYARKARLKNDEDLIQSLRGFYPIKCSRVTDS